MENCTDTQLAPENQKASLASPSPVFPISSLRDIYNLPTIEQMETCIDEIKICMMQARAANDLFVVLANLEGANVNKAFEWPETLPWHDDGKGDVGTRYVTPDGDEFMSMDVKKSLKNADVLAPAGEKTPNL